MVESVFELTQVMGLGLGYFKEYSNQMDMLILALHFTVVIMYNS